MNKWFDITSSQKLGSLLSKRSLRALNILF
jgi:hypothetical protein